MSAWLSDRLLERTDPETSARYWKEDVDEVRLIDYAALPEPDPSTGTATVRIRLCVDEIRATNRPLALTVGLVRERQYWQIDGVQEQPADAGLCEA